MRVNWSERDEKYTADVRETAGKILNAPGRPVRLSRTGIAKELGILAVVFKHAEKLPKTNIALNKVSESIPAFAIRRIRWAAECYRKEQVPATRWKLQIRAAVGHEVAQDPTVEAALKDCSRMLRKMSEAGWLN